MQAGLLYINNILCIVNYLPVHLSATVMAASADIFFIGGEGEGCGRREGRGLGGERGRGK